MAAGEASMQAEASIRIAALETRSDTASLVATWLQAEWPGAAGQAASRWVAHLEGRVAGVVGLADEEDPFAPGTLPCLAELFVAPPCRGRGLGRALCRQVQEAAQARGLPPLWLFTRDRQRYFEAQGWHEVTQLARRTSRGLEWVTLMRCLSLAA